MFRGICDKDIISSLGVLAFDVFRLVYVERWMSRISAQKCEGFVEGFSFTQFQSRIVLQEDDLEVEFERRNFCRHKNLFLHFLECL